MKVMTPATPRERDAMIVVEVLGKDVGAWQRAAANAARELFALLPADRVRLYEPGERVCLQFDVQDYSDELKAAAIDAFETEWAALVPGWKERVRGR